MHIKSGSRAICAPDDCLRIPPAIILARLPPIPADQIQIGIVNDCDLALSKRYMNCHSRFPRMFVVGLT